MKGSILTNATAVDRNPTDFYPTPPNVTIALMEYLDIRSKTVWEPACGNGMMAETLVNCGVNVIATELYGQGYGECGIDFLTEPFRNCDYIITNPPFKLSELFIKRCIEHGVPFAMLLKSQYWHSSRRLKLFATHPPSAVLPLVWRPDFHFGKKGGSPTMDCLWTVWNDKPSDYTIYKPLQKPSVEEVTLYN